MKAVAFLGRTAFITGASRGIGKEIALKLAKDGANIVIAAKTAEAHPKLPGTIYTAAEDIVKAGGKALPCIVDVRDEASVEKAVKQAVEKFGGIDIVINNASAISLTGTLDTPMKRYDLMHQINTRGTFLVSQKCIPYLAKSKNPHILNISPPLVMEPHWFANHVAYTMAKYGMSMCVLGMAEELKPQGIAVNALWPWSAVWTAAMDMLGGEESKKGSRWPSIMADAAYAMLKRDSKTYTGYLFVCTLNLFRNFAIDEDVLREEGVTDLSKYSVDPNEPVIPDFFLPASQLAKAQPGHKAIGKKSGGSGGGGGAAEVITALKSLPLDTFVAKTDAIFQFHLSGTNAQSLVIDLKNAPGAVREGEVENPDVTMKLDSTDFVRLFNGELSPTAAFMQKKLKIQGDFSKGLRLEAVLKSFNKQRKAKL